MVLHTFFFTQDSFFRFHTKNSHRVAEGKLDLGTVAFSQPFISEEDCSLINKSII